MMYQDLTEREEEKKQDHPETEKQVEVIVAHMSTWNKTTEAKAGKMRNWGQRVTLNWIRNTAWVILRMI